MRGTEGCGKDGAKTRRSYVTPARPSPLGFDMTGQSRVRAFATWTGFTLQLQQASLYLPLQLLVPLLELLHPGRHLVLLECCALKHRPLLVQLSLQRCASLLELSALIFTRRQCSACVLRSSLCHLRQVVNSGVCLTAGYA